MNFHEQAWFNPTLNYAHFMVLGLALNIWQQCCTLTAAANVVGERKMSSWHQVKASGVSKLRFFLGKSAVHIFVFMALVLPIFALAFGPMGLPLKSDPMMSGFYSGICPIPPRLGHYDVQYSQGCGGCS